MITESVALISTSVHRIFFYSSIIQNLNGQRKLSVGCSIFHAAANYCQCCRHLLVLGLGKTSVQAIWRPFVRSLVPSYFNEDSRLLSQQDSGPSAHNTTLVKEGNRWLRFAAWLKQHWKIQKEKKIFFFLYVCSPSFIWCFFFPLSLIFFLLLSCHSFFREVDCALLYNVMGNWKRKMAIQQRFNATIFGFELPRWCWLLPHCKKGFSWLLMLMCKFHSFWK